MTNLLEPWCVSKKDPDFEDFKPFYKWLTNKNEWDFNISYYGKDYSGYGAMFGAKHNELTVAKVKETIEWQEYLNATNHIPDVGKMIESDNLKSFNEKIEEEARELWRMMYVHPDARLRSNFDIANKAYRGYIERFSKKPIDNTDQK